MRVCRLLEHYSWITAQLAHPDNRDQVFWQAMSLVLEQMQGMLQGYNQRAASPEGQQLHLVHISLHEWLALNTMGKGNTRWPAHVLLADTLRPQLLAVDLCCIHHVVFTSF